MAGENGKVDRRKPSTKAVEDLTASLAALDGGDIAKARAKIRTAIGHCLDSDGREEKVQRSRKVKPEESVPVSGHVRSRAGRTRSRTDGGEAVIPNASHQG